MDITPNVYDGLTLRITTISPTARNILESEMYRLRIYEDEIDSESVLQELIIALRDDLSEIGLYLKGPLSDIYTNFSVLNSILNCLEYVFPSTFYIKIRDIAEIRPAIQSILNGGVGEESTLTLYLNWLGRSPDCFDPSCRTGADWLAEYMTATSLFDTYLANLINVQSTLDHPVLLSPDDHRRYTDVILEKANRMYIAIYRIMSVIQDTVMEDKLHRRISLYIRFLMQPDGHAERAWLMTTDPSLLSDDLRIIYEQRLTEFEKSQKLYGAYYFENPDITLTPFIVIGIAIRLWADLKDADRSIYMEALTKELTISKSDNTTRTLTVILNSLVVQIVSALFTTPHEVETPAHV